MIVTDLLPLDKKRTKVCLDGEEAFVLYNRELKTFCIERDAELSDAACEEILKVLLPKRAKLRAMHLLEQRPYTEHKLREKLRDGHYPQAVIDEALSYVKSFRYVDDYRYAMDYVTYHLENRPKNRIRNDLVAKGIARDTVEQAIEEAYTEFVPSREEGGSETTGEESPEYRLALKELSKKHFDPAGATYEERQKMKAFLYRKGFSMDVIDRAITAEM